MLMSASAASVTRNEVDNTQEVHKVEIDATQLLDERKMGSTIATSD